MENNNTQSHELVPSSNKPVRRTRHKAEKQKPAAENRPKNNKRNFALRRKPRSHAAYAKQRENRFHKPSLGEKLVNTLSGLIGKSLKIIIPWAIISVLVFSYGAYAIFHTATLNSALPTWYIVLLAIVVFGGFGFFGLIYGIAMALLYTVKYFSESVGSLVRETINRIKNSIESKIDNFSDSLSKKDVVTVIKNTFEDLSRNVRRYAANTAVGLIAIAALGSLLFFTKKTLIRSAAGIRNKADFFAVLSAKTALFAAVILNLSFFAKLAIWAGYLIGLLVILAQIITIFLIK